MHEAFLVAAERRRLTEAHTVATLFRADRLPKLTELVAHLEPKRKRRRPPKPTVKQARAAAEALIHQLGGEDRTKAPMKEVAPC